MALAFGGKMDAEVICETSEGKVSSAILRKEKVARRAGHERSRALDGCAVRALDPSPFVLLADIAFGLNWILGSDGCTFNTALQRHVEN